MVAACAMDPAWVDALANVAVAFLTLVLAVFAIWGPSIIGWLYRPQISLSSATVYTPWADRSTGEVRGRVLYLHLRLTNSGKGPARDVEVSIEEVYERNAEGRFIRVREADYPKIVVWSYEAPRTTIAFLHKETTKVVALGHVHDPVKRPAFEEPNQHIVTPDASLALEVPETMVPLNRSHAFGPGNYRFHAVVASTNMKPIHATVDAEVTGTWSESDASAVARCAVEPRWTLP